jgi:hypothetical protein
VRVARARYVKGRKMKTTILKTTISAYWPLVVAVTLVGLAALQAYGDKTRHEPLGAAEVSAELARAVSYGIIDGNVVQASSAVQRASSPELPQAS